MNPCVKHLNKIEFVVTDACTGRCRHCSEGDHPRTGVRIDPAVAADTVRKVAGAYSIQTVMAFGGEPLLYPDAVYAIISAAKEMEVPRRQVITNGFFAKDSLQIKEVAERLALAGVNDLLVSVDAFHAETIPLEAVKCFVRAAVACGIPTRLQPAWLKSPEGENPYDSKTRALLAEFCDMGVTVGEGNLIFPEGNAKKHLAEYFTDTPPANPYIEDPLDLRTLSLSAAGDVLQGNVYKQDIMEIIEKYTPSGKR